MRIALFHNLPSGGAKRHTYEQVKELANRGHELVEFAPSTADLNYCSLAPYVKNQYVYDLLPANQTKRRIPLLTPYLNAFQGIETLRRTERVNREIAKEIDNQGVDMVFVKDCHIAMNPYVLRYLKTKNVFQCHHGLRHRVEKLERENNSTGKLGKIKDIYYSPAKHIFQDKYQSDEVENIRSASLVLTNSEYSKRLISDHYHLNSRVVYPGIDIKKFRPLSIEKSNYVLSVGSLIFSKGYRFLISSLACIDAVRRPNLFIAANSRDHEEEQVVRKMARELGVNIHIEEITDDERLVQVYNQARVFVYAPIREALGMAPLEAMACGTPVVAVGEGGTWETVDDGLTGYLVNRDVYEFAEKVELFLSDETQRNEMSEMSIEYVRKNWTWNSAIDNLEREFLLAR